MKLTVTNFSKEDFLAENIHQFSFYGIIDENMAFLISEGFTVKEIYMYGLNRSNYTSYLPESVRHKITLNTNSGYWPILHDKFVFHNFVKDKLPTPRLLATIFRGKIFPADTNLFSFTAFDNEQYVLKPLQGGRGKGIFFVRVENSKLYLQEDEVTKHQLDTIISDLDEYGIFAHIKQNVELARIYPESTNTIRLVSMYDYEKKEPFLFAAVLRVGWNGSKPFDNFSQGGLVMNIDMVSGCLSPWKRKSNEGYIVDGTIHPDTNFQFDRFIIPHWHNIKNTMLAFLSEHPFFDYVGWDIMVTEDGFSVIEGNHNPDLDLIQIFRGYLSDNRAEALFKELNIYGQ